MQNDATVVARPALPCSTPILFPLPRWPRISSHLAAWLIAAMAAVILAACNGGSHRHHPCLHLLIDPWHAQKHGGTYKPHGQTRCRLSSPMDLDAKELEPGCQSHLFQIVVAGEVYGAWQALAVGHINGEPPSAITAGQ